jgi:hypothetical protein
VSVILTSSDANETWSYYPVDGFNSAIIDGQSTVGQSGDGTSPANGSSCAFATSGSGSDNITFNGLKITRYDYAGILTIQGTSWIIENNDIGKLLGARFNGGCVSLLDAGAAPVDHNFCHDVDFMGLFTNTSIAGASSGLTISNNVVTNVFEWPAVSGGGNDQNGGDCGGLYHQKRLIPLSQVHQHIGMAGQNLKRGWVSSFRVP